MSERLDPEKLITTRDVTERPTLPKKGPLPPILPNIHITDTGSLKPEMVNGDTSMTDAITKVDALIREKTDETITAVVQILAAVPGFDPIPADALTRKIINAFKNDSNSWIQTLYDHGTIESMIKNGRKKRINGEPVDFS